MQGNSRQEGRLLFVNKKKQKNFVHGVAEGPGMVIPTPPSVLRGYLDAK